MPLDKGQTTRRTLHRSKHLSFSMLSATSLAACGGGGGSTSPADEGGIIPVDPGTGAPELPPPSYDLSGNVIKGPLSNALVFADLDGDGVLDPNEPSQRTGNDGSFSLSTTTEGVTVVALTDDQTIDTSTGATLSGLILTAPSGSSVISPITTMMEEANLSAAAVTAAFGLPNIDPTTFNPFDSVDADAALAVEIAAHQISNTLRAVSSAIKGTGISEADANSLAREALANSVTDAAQNGTINLSDTGFIESAFTNAAGQLDGSSRSTVLALSEQGAAAVSNVNSTVATATDLSSDESKALFRLGNDLSEQVETASEQGGDAEEITFADEDALNDVLSDEDPAPDPEADDEGLPPSPSNDDDQSDEEADDSDLPADIPPTDTDGDGVSDEIDDFPQDPNETTDTDGDGVGDNSDTYPNDPTEWSDKDGDGVGDNSDVYPTDPERWENSYDTTPPTLISLTIPSEVDVSSGPATFSISATATDDIAGVSEVVVWLDDEISYSFSPSSTSYSGSSILGLFSETDWADGSATEDWSIASTNPSGTVNVTRVTIEDMQGNSRTYYADDLETMGVNTQIEIVRSGDDAPNASDASFNATQDNRDFDLALIADANIVDPQVDLTIRFTSIGADFNEVVPYGGGAFSSSIVTVGKTTTVSFNGAFAEDFVAGDPFLGFDFDVGSAGSVAIEAVSLSINGEELGVETSSFSVMEPENLLPDGIAVITGTVTEGETLTADTSSLDDADGLGTLSYQWLRDGSAIAVATSSSYTLVEADVGSQISVIVSYTDGGGTNESVTSAETAVVSAFIETEPAFPKSITFDPGSVTIQGDDEAISLTVTFSGDVRDLDVGGIHFYSPNLYARQYYTQIPIVDGVMQVDLRLDEFAMSGEWFLWNINWLDGGENIVAQSEDLAAIGLQTVVEVVNSGGDGERPVLTDVDLSLERIDGEIGILARLNASDSLSGLDDFSIQLRSPSGQVFVDVGEFLPNGSAEVFFRLRENYELGSYEVFDVQIWDDARNNHIYREFLGNPFAQASLITDFDRFIDVPETLNSDPTGAVTIDSIPTEGETLMAVTSTLADEDGLGEFSYQWLRDGLAISGATSSSYTLVEADVGSQISVRVSYTDGGGTDESVTTAETAIVASENEPFSIKFDYRFDDVGFFADPARRDFLDEAARIWGEIIQDDFESIPAGVTVDVLDPSDGTTRQSVTLTQSIDDVLIFVGARPSSSFLGRAGPDGFSAEGDIFRSRISDDFRGAGPVTNFEPWVGSLTFSSTADWSFDMNQIPSGKYDFLSVALHEIGHVLGYGTSAAFDAFVSSGRFSGPNAVAENGGVSVPLVSSIDTHVIEGHREDSVLMDPTQADGTRNLPTDLDKAILADIGYSIIGYTQQGSQPPLSTNYGELIFGTVLNDRIDGQGGDDQIQGNDGDDWLGGGGGDDALFGGDGDDTLLGSSGADQLIGGDGADTLFGGIGDDNLWGEGGRDVFIFASGDGDDTINDFDFGSDLIAFSGSLFSSAQAMLSNITSPFTNVFRIDLGGGNQVDVFHEPENGDFLTVSNFQILEDGDLPTATSLIA